MAKSKRIWSLLVVGVAAYGAYRLADAALGTEGGDHLANQLWIGKLPKTDREIVEHMVLLDQDAGRFGVWGKSSAWRHDLEIFKWARERDRLLLFFPQTRRKARAGVRTWECEGEAPKPFQLCLEVTLDGKKRRYYSREDWVVEPGELTHSIEEIVADTPELDGYLDGADELE
jgi:hypothetical protein